MIEEINLEGFRGAAGHVRCFPHILNLAVKVLWGLDTTLSHYLPDI